MKVAVSLVALCVCYLIALAVVGEGASTLKEEVEQRLELLDDLQRKEDKLFAEKDKALDDLYGAYVGPYTDVDAEYFVRGLGELYVREKEVMEKKRAIGESSPERKRLEEALKDYLQSLKVDEMQEIIEERSKLLGALKKRIQPSVRADTMKELNEQEKLLLDEKRRAIGSK